MLNSRLVITFGHSPSNLAYLALIPELPLLNSVAQKKEKATAESGPQDSAPPERYGIVRARDWKTELDSFTQLYHSSLGGRLEWISATEQCLIRVAERVDGLVRPFHCPGEQF